MQPVPLLEVGEGLRRPPAVEQDRAEDTERGRLDGLVPHLVGALEVRLVDLPGPLEVPGVVVRPAHAPGGPQRVVLVARFAKRATRTTRCGPPGAWAGRTTTPGTSSGPGRSTRRTSSAPTRWGTRPSRRPRSVSSARSCSTAGGRRRP